MYIYDIQSDLWHRNYPKLKLKFGAHCAPVLPKINIIEDQNIRLSSKFAPIRSIRIIRIFVWYN